MIVRDKMGAVIIFDGRTYALFHEDPVVRNNVCDMCTLRYQCWTDDEDKMLRDICENSQMPESSFFLEVKPSTKVTIFDIACDQDIFNACEALEYVNETL